MSLTSPMVQVLTPSAAPRPFQYGVPEGMTLDLGQVVQVPVRSKPVWGVVWALGADPAFTGQVKEVLAQVPHICFSKAQRDFITWVSEYTLAPLGLVLKMCLSGADFQAPLKPRKILEIGSPHLSAGNLILSPDQEEAALAIGQALSPLRFQPFLLDGVTGSGKTEVYFTVMEQVFRTGGQVMVLLPEIALTTQWLTRFEQRFGCAPLVWHSGLTPRVRQQTWEAVARGQACVIVGARSALFLPFAHLQLIIVDEEHDATYKQDEQVLYHARDMALVRARGEGIPIVLASATPSLETYLNATSGRYGHLHLKHRHGAARLPEIRAVDMRPHPQAWLSPPLVAAMAQRLERGEQSMLFLNRRGYAPLTLCRQCGYRFKCPACTSWLVEHRRFHNLQCHHCGFHRPIPPQCPECEQEDTLVACGPGVERLEEMTRLQFPQARLALLTSDTMATPEKSQVLLESILQGQVDIVIGTQILAKGYHFPKMTLVGVIDADAGLGGGDLRASERTYQLLHQVAGRAGREEAPGEVLVQTFQPDHPIIQALLGQERDLLLGVEAEAREARLMPPFGRLVALVLSGLKEVEVERAAKNLVRQAPPHPQIQILGPVPAPLAQLRGRYRWRILLRSPRSVNLGRYVSHWMTQAPVPSTIRLTVDVDPHHFL